MSGGLCCPKCGYDKSYVKETRPFADGIRRRRECEKCRHRFTTYECGNDMLRRIRERAEKMAMEEQKQFRIWRGDKPTDEQREAKPWQ